MAILESFWQLMRPPGSGIPVFSTGTSASTELQRQIYGVIHADAKTADPQALETLWKHSLQGLGATKRPQVAILGVPLDTGAGIRRGAAAGPVAVRQALYALPEVQEWLRSGSLIDLGDIYVNPHLLHDEMLSREQIEASQKAMYSGAEPTLRDSLPVSALSQAKRVLSDLLNAYPDLRVFVIGGDHSCAWPVTEVMAARYPKTLSIVQPDAHTDLLPARLGVKYCFGTWSFHANELLGRGGKLVQLGIRQSGREQEHWESTTGVRQFWARELNGLSDADAVKAVVKHLESIGVRQIYLSNDIDGTDESEASATGTPAAAGLRSSFLIQMIGELGKRFELVAADVMEVAPDLGETAEERDGTCRLAARYAAASIQAMLG